MDLYKEFKDFLVNNNSSRNTISAYINAVKSYFVMFDEITKKKTLLFKVELIEAHKPKTVNLKIQCLNKYLDFIGKPELKSKSVKVQ